jgi:ABC-type cobalamin/Fe3+-siderophores transport system ATPase subunit
MAIRSFDVTGLRGLRHAEASELPNLCAISGPNGAGKSSLLELLKRNKGTVLEPGTELMYVGPHRTWRSASVNEVAVLGMPMDFSTILMQETMPGLQYPIGNFQAFSGLSRHGSSGDDAQAYVKSSIIRIRNKQQQILRREWENQGRQVVAGSVPDLFSPFGELVSTLLPHLKWIGVNDTNSNDIRCEFRNVATEGGNVFDIDELSSGEKAAIALFLPFIERAVKVLSGEQAEAQEGLVPVTVLLDEPELHLHPLLQLNVLEYMRTLAREGRAQFIFTVHSPSLLDALTKDELFLLSPAELAPDNQLSRLVDTSERLEAVRAMTGSTHLLTRCKPIVFIEGEPDDGAKATDERITRILLPDVAHWALIPTQGKQQVIKAAKEMRAAKLHLPGMPVFGLVDDDQGLAGTPDFVVSWRACMLENLLLDPEAISTVVGPYSAAVGLATPAEVRKSLLDLAGLQVEEEKRLRLKDGLPRATLTVDAVDFATAEKGVEAIKAEYLKKIKAIDLPALQTRVDSIIQGIVDRDEQLERFHGKKLLRAWFNKYFDRVGMGWNPFLIELARHASQGERLQKLASPAIDRIRLYFPSDLSQTLNSCPQGGERDALLTECDKERARWDGGVPKAEGREALRRRILQYAHDTVVEDSLKTALVQSASAIGTA